MASPGNCQHQGTYHDHLGNEFLIPQTIAGVEINIDSDEFQAWHRALVNFPPLGIFESQLEKTK